MFDINKLSKEQRVGFSMLNRETRIQREDFLTNVVEYETNRLRGMIDMWEKRDVTSEHSQYRLEANYHHAQNAFKSITTNTLRWLTDGQEYFNTKLVEAVAKLESFGFLSDDVMLDIENADINNNRGLEFYISGQSRKTGQSLGRVKARLTWISCYEKQSHYRWIVTLKNAPKVVEVVEDVVTPSPRKAAGRAVQIEALLEQGKSSKEIAETLEMNISYCRKIIRDIKNR